MLTSGCTLYRLALRYFDWVVVTETDSLFDLTNQQKAELKRLILTELPWIKQEIVRPIATGLLTFESKVESSPSVDDFIQLFSLAKEQRIYLVSRLGSHIAKQASTLSIDQIIHAEKELKEKNEKWTDLLELSDDKLYKKRRKKLISNLESWYGHLTDEQDELVCDIFMCTRSHIEISLSWSQRSVDYFIESLKEKRTKEIFITEVLRWSQDGVVPPESTVHWREFSQKWPERAWMFHTTTSPAQRKHFRQKLEDIRGDLEWFVTR